MVGIKLVQQFRVADMFVFTVVQTLVYYLDSKLGLLHKWNSLFFTLLPLCFVNPAMQATIPVIDREIKIIFKVIKIKQYLTD